jgi:effector-binding domain-containing protein
VTGRRVTLVTAPATPTAVVSESTTWDAFPAQWPRLLDEVWAVVRRTGFRAGRNVMLYKDDRPDVEVGVEALEPFTGDGRVVASRLPSGLAARAVAYGPPSAAGIAEAHAAVRAWCDANGHALDGTRWEVYGHWDDDADPAAYEIEVYWLVR